MSLPLAKPMSLDEFLAWEADQDTRWEFDGFAPVAMAGGTAAQARLQRNLAISVGSRLRGGPCEFFGSDMKIIAAGSVRYPDGTVVCSPVGQRETRASDPVVIFEVLSEGTQETDRVVKLREYRDTPSVRRYVMLEPTRVAATVFARDPAGRWIGEVLYGDDTLAMPEIGVEFPLAELYADLDLGAPQAAA